MIEDHLLRLNAKGYRVWLHQRDDKFWQCTLHLFGETNLFFTLHVAELETSILQAEAFMDKKLEVEGWPKKPEPKVKAQTYSSGEAEALLKELGIV